MSVTNYLTLQVTPTVGVHDDDASGKKSANLQKHFRHLVNETASKQRFLRSLHRTNSAKEGSGSLPTTFKQQSSANLEPIVKEPVDSNCRDQRQGQSAFVNDTQAVDVKLEVGIKEEPEAMPSGRLESEPAEANERAYFGLADSACLPDSLGEELGDAACLKADPDTLMADALQPLPTLPVSSVAADSLPANAAMQAPDQTGLHSAPADHTEVVREFLGILGEAVDADTARDFVTRAGGCLAAAINSYYDSADVVVGTTANATDKASDAGQASSSETCAKSATHSLAQSADMSAAVSAAKKPASQLTSAKPVSKGKKRTATAQVHTADKPAKKQRPASTAQRSIATFFGAGQPSVTPKPANGNQQRPDGSAGKAPDREGVHAKFPQQRVGSPQQVITAAAAARIVHAVTIDLAADCVEHEDPDVQNVGSAHTEQAAASTSPQTPADPSTLSLRVPFTHDGGQSRQEEAASQAPQPVHPFFGKGKRQAKKIPSAADDAATSARQGKASAERPSRQSEGKLADPQDKVNLKEEPPRTKPVKKAQPEPEKDVPADAVLLPTSEYDPVKMAVWEAGQATPYRHISRAFQAMESTTKRLRIGDAIANMFRSILALSPGELPFCLCSTGTSRPYILSVCLWVPSLLPCCCWRLDMCIIIL